MRSVFATSSPTPLGESENLTWTQEPPLRPYLRDNLWSARTG